MPFSENNTSHAITKSVRSQRRCKCYPPVFLSGGVERELNIDDIALAAELTAVDTLCVITAVVFAIGDGSKPEILTSLIK